MNFQINESIEDPEWNSKNLTYNVDCIKGQAYLKFKSNELMLFWRKKVVLLKNYVAF